MLKKHKTGYCSMGQNQAVLLTYLKDILLSEEEITTAIENRDHIFEMQDEESNSLGFISLYDLKAYVFEHEEEAGGYSVRNIDSTDWTGVFEHPSFQRRKPQLVPMSSIQSESDLTFYILKHGQKSGPYEKFELTSLLEEKELLLTDMVSYNGGHTWMKLYQVEDFDRRVLKESDQLPGVPSTVISQTNDHVIAVNPETDAISGLAYLSNVKRGKTIEREKAEILNTDMSQKAGTSSIYKWLLVLSIVGIGYFLFHIKNQLLSPFNEGQTTGEHAEMLTPVENSLDEGRMPPQTIPGARSQLGERHGVNQINDQGRSGGKFETRTMQPIVPRAPKKSFMDTAQFQAATPESNASEDPNYYYDNTSAMELDPVRSQVSKENFDEPTGPIPSSDQAFESELSN